MDDFLKLVQKKIPARSRKKIIKDSLRGIAELHDRDIVHLGSSPSFPQSHLCMDCTVLSSEADYP